MIEKDFARDLGITKEGYETTNGSYVIELDNSNEFSKIYTLLDKNEDADLDVETIHMNEELVEMTYLTDGFDVTLRANLKENKYMVEIKEAM